jgi:ribosomal protein S12 methylthiotransferase accessory factor
MFSKERYEAILDDTTLQKRYFGASHRICDPHETVARILPRLDQLGITRVANVTGLDWIGIPVIMVTRPNSRSVSVSQGKGLTLDAARASGLMEAVELYHAENITKPLVLASWEELSKRVRTICPYDLPIARTATFEPSARMLWIEGFDLLAGTPCWVPLTLVTTDATGTDLPGGEVFCSTSNGLASGNHILEAVCHALCELVERDATTLWFLSDAEVQRIRRLDLSSIHDAATTVVLHQFAAADMEPMIWDVTSNIGVPVFLCLLCEKGNRPERAIFGSMGMGCHPAREVALLRALTEAAQARLTLISGVRDDVFRTQYENGDDKARTMERYRALRPDAEQWRRFEDIGSFNSATVNEDVDWLLGCLHLAGIRHAVVVDLTEDDFRIPVVRMIVPGLEAPASAANFTPGKRARRLQT